MKLDRRRVEFTKNMSSLNGNSIPKSKFNYFEFELRNYLKIYYDFVYFLCLCPFRLVWIQDSSSATPGEVDIEDRGGMFRVKCWWPQKIICGIFTLLGLTWFLRDIRLTIPSTSGGVIVSLKDPTIYFEFMNNITGCLLKLNAIRVFWGKGEELSGILNFLTQQSSVGAVNFPTSRLDNGYRKENLRQKRKNIAIFLICLIYTVISLLNWALGRGLSRLCYEGPKITRLNWRWWWAAVVEACKYNFFMETNVRSNATVCGEGNDLMGGLDTLLGVLGSLGFYYRRMLSSHCNCFLLMAIMTLWTSINQFISELSTTEVVNSSITMETVTAPSSVSNQWTHIHQHYQAIKQLAKMINSVYGHNVTLFIIESILYYAVSFDDIFVENTSDNDITKVLRLLFYFGSTCAVLFAAADVSKQIIYFKEWLSAEENRRAIPADQLYLLINELDTNVISIKGSNVFPITYSLAAKVLGVTVTYFIICVQV